MAKWLCRCGTQMQASGDIPNPQQWLLHSDVDFEAFQGVVEAESVYRAATHAYRCQSCDRLYVFWDGYDSEPAVYARDRT